jgi:dTMP kinase
VEYIEAPANCKKNLPRFRWRHYDAHPMARGKFITFEGGEGCGKSTQMERLAARLRDAGHTVTVTREPGGTDIGEQIRDVLQYSRKSSAMKPETELLLFSASRAQLVREIILPALERGEHVLCDRFADSTRVYQGVARGLNTRDIESVTAFAVGNCIPDLTLLIDLEPKIGLERVRGRALFDRMEQESLAFYENVRRAYLELAKREPHRVKIIDGSQDPEAMADQIWKIAQHVVA